MKYSHQITLVFVIVFAAFYMTVYGDICVVDDFSAVMHWLNAKDTTLKQIFLPGSAAGGYYRPFIGLSYLINLRLWDLDSRMLHLENVLIHVSNACLVCILTYSLLSHELRKRTLAPLVAGLFFGLHPITTESVDWISGRTDLLAGFFVLISAILLARFKENNSKYYLAGASCSLLLGLLGKEVALGFIPGALFLLFAREDESCRIPAPSLSFKGAIWFVLLAGLTILIELVFFNFWIIFLTIPIYSIIIFKGKRIKDSDNSRYTVYVRNLVIGILAISLSIALFFLIRSIVFKSNIEKIPQTIRLIEQDPNYALSVFLQSTGFYIKKFFIPFPLNFAIREIDPLYAILGTIFVFVGIIFIARRAIPTAMSLAGVFLFAPALPLAFGTIAWTAYAERYIYISTAFWSIAIVVWLNPYLQRIGPKLATYATSLLLIIMAVFTIQRNLVWHNSLLLIRDTVRKSPRFREARIIYMSELMKAGDLKGAKEQFAIASSIPAVRYDERLDNAMAEIYLQEGKEDDALRMYEQIFKKTQGSSQIAYKQIRSILEKRIDKENRAELRLRLVRMLERYRQLSEDGYSPTINNRPL